MDLLAAESKRRGLWSGPLSLGEAFRLVRDMPYRRPSQAASDQVIRQWRGTCSGKHQLLHALFLEAEYPARLMIATYHYRWSLAVPPPDDLAAILADGPVPDVHNFLEVWHVGSWVPLDATWPSAGAGLGFAVNDSWQPGVAHHVACGEPYTAWPVPTDADFAAYKARVVRQWCGDDLERRERLIEGFSRFVARAGI